MEKKWKVEPRWARSFQFSVFSVQGGAGKGWKRKLKNGEGRTEKGYFFRLIVCLNLSTAKLSSTDVSESVA